MKIKDEIEPTHRGESEAKLNTYLNRLGESAEGLDRRQDDQQQTDLSQDLDST